MRYLTSLSLLVATLVIAACGSEKPASDEPGYDSIISVSTAIPGFVPMFWNEEEGKLYLEIERLDDPFIYVSGLSAGIGSNDLGMDRGQLGDTRLARFDRRGPKVLLLADNPKYIASSDNPDERAAVEQAFARSVVWGFEVAAESDGKLLVDASEFFLRDAHGVGARLKQAEEGVYTVDATRSAIFLPRTKGFPDNSEVDATLTLVGEPTGKILGSVSPDAGIITVHQHHSFVRLPDDGYTPLPYDPRSGFIDLYDNQLIYDYATPINEAVKKAYTWRHRLKKKDPSAEVSEAVEPIVYYVDRGAPEPIRSALIEGASWWNQAFEAAGYKDAFQVKLLPEGADPLDIRYNVIQWVHRSTRGWSYGYSVRDPRTQEILKGHVSLGSLRVRQDLLLAEGFLAPYADQSGSPELEGFALARIRQLSAHEVGHTIGLEHNFAASTNDRASVMDYPYPYVTLAADGSIDVSQAYSVDIGDWDKRAVLWGYQDFPADVDATAERKRIIADTYASGLNYVADRHSRGDGFAVTAGPSSPRGNLWDNGADPVVELNRLMTLRAAVLERFSAHNIQLGRPLASLEDVLVPMYLMHRFQLQAAATVIGGRDFSYALRGDGQVPTVAIPGARQRQAIDSMLATLSPNALRLSAELVAMIPPRPPGSGDSRELFPRQTGYVFDPLAAAGTAAGLTLDQLLNVTRAARMNNNHVSDPGQPDFAELVREVMQTSWYRERGSKGDASLQRVVDTAVLSRLMRLAGNPDAQVQARAQAYDSLVELEKWLRLGIESTENEQRGRAWLAHYRFSSELIRRFRESPDAIVSPSQLKVPPGSPI
ncbi:MAG: zinc-dependent metalloprotease [Halioglobus sp.]